MLHERSTHSSYISVCTGLEVGRVQRLSADDQCEEESRLVPAHGIEEERWNRNVACTLRARAIAPQQPSQSARETEPDSGSEISAPARLLRGRRHLLSTTHHDLDQAHCFAANRTQLCCAKDIVEFDRKPKEARRRIRDVHSVLLSVPCTGKRLLRERDMVPQTVSRLESRAIMVVLVIRAIALLLADKQSFVGLVPCHSARH